MCESGIWIAAGMLAALVSSNAAAQQGRGAGAFGGGFNNLNLLSQKSVQEELKLSEDQTTQVTELAEKQRGSLAELRNLDREQRQQKLQESVTANDAVVAGILKEEQLKRLEQIVLQQRGAAAFNDPAVAEALVLTQEQKDRLRELQQGAQSEIRDLVQGGDRQAAQPKIRAVRESLNEKSQAVLTSEQKEKLKTLSGEPFKGEITRPQPRGNRPNGAARPASRRARPGQAAADRDQAPPAAPAPPEAKNS